MPDRLPPNWGREPEDGRDLEALLSAEAPVSVEALLVDEALLSGQMTGISETQRPVAGAMFALRAAPAASELAGEAAARAAFRALIAPAGTVPAGPGPAASAPAGAWAAGYGSDWSWGDSGGAEPQHTLVLPVPAAGQVPYPPARHRHRRRAVAGRRGWHVAALAGSAAAVVAVGAVAWAGTFSGSAAHRGQAGSSAAATSSRASANAPAVQQSVLGRGQATKDPTPSATPTASATPGATTSHGASPTGADLCRQFFGSDGHHSHGDRTKKRELFEELSQLAGSPMKVLGYCAQQSHPVYAATAEPTSSLPGFGYPGSEGGNARPDSGAGTRQAGSGVASPAGSGSSQGNGGPGSGGSR